MPRRAPVAVRAALSLGLAAALAGLATPLAGAAAGERAAAAPGERAGAAGERARGAERAPSGGGDIRGLFVGGAQRGPISIDARRFEVDNRKRTATYLDQVVVRQEDTTLTADKLIVAYDESRRISEVRAEGNVRIVQKVAADPAAAAGSPPSDREAQCARAVFVVADDRIVCTGGPAMLRQGDDLIRGSKITVSVGDERIVVEGDNALPRVTSRITPRDGLGGARGTDARPPQGGPPGQGGSQGQAGSEGQAGSARPN